MPAEMERGFTVPMLAEIGRIDAEVAQLRKGLASAEKSLAFYRNPERIENLEAMEFSELIREIMRQDEATAHLRDLLKRSRMHLHFEQWEQGGIVAEIDAALAEEEETKCPNCRGTGKAKDQWYW
jgi:hypothetical protein